MAEWREKEEKLYLHRYINFYTLLQLTLKVLLRNYYYYYR